MSSLYEDGCCCRLCIYALYSGDMLLRSSLGIRLTQKKKLTASKLPVIITHIVLRSSLMSREDVPPICCLRMVVIDHFVAISKLVSISLFQHGSLMVEA